MLMNAKVEKEACTTIEESVKRSLAPTVVWNGFPSDAIESMVRVLHSFSDKSRMAFN